MKNVISSISVAILLALAPKVHAAPDRNSEPLKLTLEQSKEKLGKPGVFFFDVNPREIYARGHLPGARNVAITEVSEKTLPADRSASLVFYCMSEMCTASHSAAKKALALNYRNVFVMPAGIRGWTKAGLPTEN